MMDDEMSARADVLRAVSNLAAQAPVFTDRLADALSAIARAIEASPEPEQGYRALELLLRVQSMATSIESDFYRTWEDRRTNQRTGSEGGNSKPRPAWETEGNRLFKKHAVENPDYTQTKMADYIREHMKHHNPVGFAQTTRAIRRWQKDPQDPLDGGKKGKLRG